MMKQLPQKNEAKIIKASTALQKKIGTGIISEEKIKKSQNVLDNNTQEFAPIADEFLNKLINSINAIRPALSNPDNDKKMLADKLSTPVMQLKGTAGMFGYPLVSNLANIMLSFLESVSNVDQNVLDIVEAHHKTLHMIVNMKMRGDGGANGLLLQNELQGACNRYLNRNRREI